MRECILFSILLITLLFIINDNTIENMTGASDCQQSINDFNNALQLQQQQDKEAYNVALQTWQGKKQSVIYSFQSNTALWPSSAGICSGSRCEPITAFFQVHENSNLSGWNKEQTSADWETCLRKCKDRTDCEWVNWSNNGTCYINSLGNRQGSQHGFKTDNGYIKYSDQYIDGYTENLPNYQTSSPDECQRYCDQNASCKHWQWNPSDNRCWLQHVGVGSTNMKVGVKMPKTNLTFSDNDPYVIQQIGQPPSLQHTPVELSIVCQDCRQSLGTSQITDSTQVNMSQLNQCIANIKAKEDTPTSNTSNTPTSNTSNSPTSNTSNNTPTSNTSNTPTSNTSNNPNTSNTSSETSTESSQSPMKWGLMMGIGGAIVLCIIIIVVIVMMTKKTQ